MLGGSHHVEPRLVGKNGHLAQLVDHLLVLVVIPADGPQLLALFKGLGGDARQGKQHEFHTTPPVFSMGCKENEGGIVGEAQGRRKRGGGISLWWGRIRAATAR